MLFQKILVAFDGSEGSWKAFDFALELSALCKKNGYPEIYVLSVVRPPEPIEIVEMGAVIDAATTLYEEQFRKIVAKVKDRDLVLHTDILTGSPADQIVRYAHDNKCDVVILGHRGKSVVEDWLLGSVPKRVSSYAPCHVIIVK
jgi:nucleotide-binding universal stress UspA family protein